MKTEAVGLSQKKLLGFDKAVEREWIITNNLGGYASSTAIGMNTRKYHGLLVAAFHPPSDRRVCLEKINEEIGIGNSTYPLGTDEFQGEIFPQGHIHLKEFVASPFPKYVYSVNNVEVQKTVFMPHEKNAIITLYSMLNNTAFEVTVRAFPIINWRHFHSVTDRWKVSEEPVQIQAMGRVRVSCSGPKCMLLMSGIGGRYYARGKWVQDIFYREEADRGESCLDDCYQTGFFEFLSRPNRKEDFAVIVVADEDEGAAEKIMGEMPITIYDVGYLYQREVEQRKVYLSRFYENYTSLPKSDWLSELVLATDEFIVKNVDTEEKSVIAGYHWFESWGRDTFVSLPGLMLVTSRFEDARRVFLNFRNHFRQGLIPNFIPDSGGEPAYNSVDATLWYVNAVLQYLKYTNDSGFVRTEMWETLKAVVDDLSKGTAFNIHVDADGLLSHGPQLTWVDAAVYGQPVTPRAGKAVEVQALWYNALKIMELLASKFEENNEADKYAGMADKARKSFIEKFWNAQDNCLYDVVADGDRDGSLRPNQILAVALDFTMLDNFRNEKVVDAVQRELLTPFGLRTLARNDSKYKGVYSGDRASRDTAYHNGTVWPWLLGPFVTAFLKAKGLSEFRRDLAMGFLSPLFTKHVLESGVGTINEIFDGDPPHKPRGCIAQAWSTAEPLRAYVEDVMRKRPTYEIEILKKSG